jgi:hypothetical protein
MSEMPTVEDDHAYWYGLLGHGPKLPFYDGRPQCGCYHLRRGSDVVPVRIFRHDGEIVVLDDDVPSPNPNKTWQDCGRTAITFETYDIRMKTGHWPGESRSIGDNQPPPEAPDELVAYTAQNALDWLVNAGIFACKAQADEATAIIDGVRKAVMAASKAHKAEKEPHLAAGRLVDERYLPKIKKAQSVITSLLAAITRYNDDERAKREREEAAKHEAERQAALQREAELSKLAAAAATATKEAERTAAVQALAAAASAAPMPSSEPALPPAPVKYGTGIGRAVKIKTVRRAVVVDQDKVYAAHRDDPDVVALLAKLAQRCVDAEVTCPGVEVKIDEIARL